ncbi:Putative 60S acidic ribosomal protein P0 [Rhizopus microsporus]|nr:Putative 60S acidic ribosomal protein P0 [Rhizopus microsporus]
MSKRESKAIYFQKLNDYLNTYQSIFIVNVDNNLLAVSVASDYTFEGSEKIKEYLANPEAFAVAAPAAAAAADSSAPAAEEKPAEEEESDDDMGFGLFD